MTRKETTFGSDLKRALKEVKAHRRGGIALPLRQIDVIKNNLMTVIEPEPDVVEATVAKGRTG